MSDTIFMKIIRREIPARIVHEDEHCLAFHDVNPQAPTHVLVIPKQPLAQLSDAGPGHEAMLGRLLLAARDVAEKLQLRDGYRVVINNGAAAGQTVFHLHLHVLAGRHFTWPPG